jgi:hypothetical protein
MAGDYRGESGKLSRTLIDADGKDLPQSGRWLGLQSAMAHRGRGNGFIHRHRSCNV